MKPLPHPNNLHLQAAEGWLGLGNPAEAKAELARIPARLHTHPQVLEARWHIAAREQHWEECVAVAAALIEKLPGHEFGWIHRAYALHELKRTQEALDCLLPVVKKFPKVWTFPYNLACYCAQLGRLEESAVWLRKALKLDEATVLEQAADDPDLKPLRATPGWTALKKT